METTQRAMPTHFMAERKLAASRPDPEPTHTLAWMRRLAFAKRGCCCAARPAVVAIMMPTTSRPRPVDLLLCTDHYMRSEAALAEAGAVVHVSL